jgi:hypothetical protein
MRPEPVYHDMEQRTPEWYAVRRGVLTASGLKPWLLNRSATSNKARSKVLRQLASERHDEDEWDVKEREAKQRSMSFIPAVARGVALEADALAVFAEENPGFVNVGFVRRGWIGCSPDAINFERKHGLEIKCPSAATMIDYCVDRTLPEDYALQVHISMYVTGFKAWNFLAYSTKYYPVCIRILHDEFTEKVGLALDEFQIELEEQIQIDKKYSYDRK